MTTGEYQKANSKLFEDWERKLRATIHVGVDGAINPDKYYSSNPRILFVLKEMNVSPWERQSLIEYLNKDQINWKTWNNVVRWGDAIRQVMNHTEGDKVVSYVENKRITDLERKRALSDLAIINLKKVPGGSSGNMPTIIQHAEHFKTELSEQIKMLDPDVIVACGVYLKNISGFEGIEEEAVKKDRSFLIHPFDNRARIIIYTDHSQAYKATAEMRDQVIQACDSAKLELADMSRT